MAKWKYVFSQTEESNPINKRNIYKEKYERMIEENRSKDIKNSKIKTQLKNEVELWLREQPEDEKTKMRFRKYIDQCINSLYLIKGIKKEQIIECAKSKYQLQAAKELAEDTEEFLSGKPTQSMGTVDDFNKRRIEFNTKELDDLNSY